MAEVDTSFYPKPGALPNPLEMAGKLQTLQTGMLNNRLLGQEIGGKEALGRAFTKATNPETGVVDYNAVPGLVAQDPTGAFATPAANQAAQQRELAVEQIAKARAEGRGAEIDLWGKKMETGANFALGLISQGPVTKEAFANGAKASLIASGLFDDPQSQQRLVDIYQRLGDNPAQNAAVLEEFVLQTKPTIEAINMTRGPATTLDRGPEIIDRQVSPLTGEVTINAVTPKGRTPSETAAIVNVYDPVKKQMVQQTSGSYVGDAPAGQRSGTLGAGGPALGEAQDAEASVAQSTALQSRAAAVPQRRAALRSLVDTLHDFTPGPKANLTYQIGALAQQLGTAPPSVTTGVAAQEEFNKLAAELALAQFSTLGGTGANDQLNTSLKANPSDTMSKMGIRGVTALLQGNEQAIGAQFDAWKKFSAKNGPSSYGNFLAGWNRYYDPRVFQAQFMEPKARDAMMARMTPEERKTFNRNKSVAEQAGWLGQ